MKDFKISGINMNQLSKDLETLQQDIDDAYVLFETLMSRIKSEQEWEGRAKDAFAAYMGLLGQYHVSFSEKGEENPLEMARKALKQAEENVNNYYTDYTAYKDLETIE